MTSALERVRGLVRAAERIASPTDPLGVEARRVLPGSTGLSPEGVELVLTEHLETRPSEAELDRLVAGVAPAPHAHVVLSATVCTAALRAILLALAASEDVSVRPSRREPEMVRLLHAAAPGTFRVVSDIHVAESDHVFVYGRDETVEAVRRNVPPSATVFGHGTGIGVVLLSVDLPEDERRLAAEAVARDVVPFDQRGCLSPRIVLATGTEENTRRFAEALARALTEAERRVPRGTLTPEERTAATTYRDAMLYAGDLLEAGAGAVGVDAASGALVLPPTGRHIHVARPTDVAVAARSLTPLVTAVSVAGPPWLHATARASFPEARKSALGYMQRPPLDGPVDGRTRFFPVPRRS